MLLGLSGGADSVALLLLLLAHGVEVVAAHANFCLRGEESARDEEFVRQLCKEKGVPLVVHRFNTRDEAKQHGESLEMAARRLRYTWFAEECLKQHIDVVCTAHHRDDNVETFLLNLIRGSGIDGLTAMASETRLHSDASTPVLARPLLNVPRKTLEDYLAAQHQGYVCDSTNSDTTFRRNSIRHKLLPVLRTLNPSIDHTLSETISRLHDAQYYYKQGIRAELAAVVHRADGISSIALKTLQTHPAPRTLLHAALATLFPPAMLPQIVGLVDSPVGRYVTHGDTMLVRTSDAIEWGNPAVPLLPESSCSIDADRVRGVLRLRPLHDGDRFRPFGLHGSKLVNDYLSDRHISLLRRHKARALCDDAGIVWLVGYEIDQRVAVTPETLHTQTLYSSSWL